MAAACWTAGPWFHFPIPSRRNPVILVDDTAEAIAPSDTSMVFA